MLTFIQTGIDSYVTVEAIRSIRIEETKDGRYATVIRTSESLPIVVEVDDDYDDAFDRLTATTELLGRVINTGCADYSETVLKDGEGR